MNVRNYLFLLVSFFIVIGCEAEPEVVVELESISVDTSNLQDEYEINDFSIDSLTLVLTMDDGSTDEIQLDTSLISDTDLAKLEEAGQHVIGVSYNQLVTQFSVKLYDATLRNQNYVEEAVEEAKLLFTYINNISKNIELPNSFSEDVEVTWQSSTNEHLSFIENGSQYMTNITRPKYNHSSVDVTIYATFNKGDVEDSYEWVVTILAESEPPLYDNFDLLHSNTPHSDYVTAEGIVVAFSSGGFLLTDGVNYFNVYGSNDELNLGDLVQVKGVYTNYFTTYQISSTTTKVIGTDLAYDLNPTELTLEALINLDATNDKLISAQPFRVQGLVEQLTPEYHTNWYLTHGDLKVQIYHWSLNESLDYLENYKNQVIEVTVFYYVNHPSNGVLLLIFEPHMNIEVVNSLPGNGNNE